MLGNGDDIEIPCSTLLAAPPHRRREMLDLSINKLQTMSQRAPELRKSVLIFNTMRVLQVKLVGHC